MICGNFAYGKGPRFSFTTDSAVSALLLYVIHSTFKGAAQFVFRFFKPFRSES